MSPQRIQRQRVKGWHMPDGAVYVGRPSKWGNPYCTCKRNCGHMPVSSPERAVELYRRAIEENDRGGRFHRECPTSEHVRSELAGKDLACWCPLDMPCHADILLDLANRDADQDSLLARHVSEPHPVGALCRWCRTEWPCEVRRTVDEALAQ